MKRKNENSCAKGKGIVRYIGILIVMQNVSWLGGMYLYFKKKTKRKKREKEWRVAPQVL